MPVRSIFEVTHQTYDLCIVGSGPAGLSLALTMAETGRHILLLESGLDRSSPAHQELSDGERADRDRHDPLTIASARRLGGTSNLWGARCQPLDPIDFDAGRPFASARWPITYGDIAPYYGEAAAFLTCGPAHFSRRIDLGPTTPDFAFDRIERFSTEPAVHQAHKDAIARARTLDLCLNATATRLSVNETTRDADRLCVRSIAGDTVWVQARRFVLAMGGIETTRFLLAQQRQTPHLFGGSDGALGRFYMGHLIGEVADVVLTSKALDEALDFAKLPGEGYVRNRLTPSDQAQRDRALPNVAFWPVVPPVAEPRHGDGVLSLIFLLFAWPPIGRRLVADAIRRRHVPRGARVAPHLWNVIKALPRLARVLPSLAYRRFIDRPRLPGLFFRNPARVYGLSFHAEQSAQADSRITLLNETDTLGMPKARVDLRFARKDAEALFRAHQELDRWLRANDLGRVEYRQPEAETVDAILAICSHGTHQIGTARMADTASGGVVDRNLRCFGTRNLYALSSAVFPTSGQCNPTLSIVAFAYRLADHLKTQST